MTDLTLPLSDGVVNIRVAAWCQHEENILVCRYQNGTITLPGGRVQFGETTEDALKREINEELNTACQKIEYVGIIENFFSVTGRRYHEFLFVYRVELEDKRAFQNTQTETFSWESLAILDHLTPTVLNKMLLAKQRPIVNREESFN